MELTQEQCNQAARYVDGEMNAREKEAFEAILLQNNALLEEVEAYKEIRLLGESIEEKINISDQQLTEKKNKNEAVWRMLQQEREHWENRHEADAKYPLHPTAANTTTHQNKSTDGKIKGMKMLRWLAVAAATGLIALGAWWYQPPEKKKLQVSVKRNGPVSKAIADNQKQDTSINILHPDVPAPKAHTSSDAVPSSRDEATAIRIKKQRTARQQLFTQNFVPDSLPFELPDVLAAPSFHYKNQRHKEAITGYKEILAGMKAHEDATPATRNVNQEELTKFYAHYYLGQSLLSVDHTSEGIRELEAALKESPNMYWSSKTGWYLALAALKTGQTEKTKALLKQVIRQDPSEIYAQKATQLARKLEGNTSL